LTVNAAVKVTALDRKEILLAGRGRRQIAEMCGADASIARLMPRCFRKKRDEAPELARCETPG
jgi:hypothetical protein